MALKYVTITGIDQYTRMDALEQLSREYPFVEFAVLILPQKEGKNNKYPSRHVRETFYASSVKNKAIHLCGNALLDLAKLDGELLRELHKVNRVQLNIIPALLPPTSPGQVSLPQTLSWVARDIPSINWITQRNSFNESTYDYWDIVANHSYLFDASLGAGVSPATWPSPHPDKFCGYAGGLGPYNIANQFPNILKTVGHRHFWIDMQSYVRNDFNVLDMDKVESVLDVVTEYHNVY